MVAVDRFARLKNCIQPLVMLSLMTAIGIPHALAVNDLIPSATPIIRHNVDDTADGWVWSGMTECADTQLLGGTGHAGMAGTSGAFTFVGTGVQVYCVAAPSIKVGGRIRKMGRIKVSIDGVEKGSANLAQAEIEYSRKAVEVSGLPAKNHVVEIVAEGGAAVVDYITVLDSTAARTDRADASSAKNAAISEGDYRLFSTAAASKCIDVEGIKQSDGTQAMLYQLNRGPNQTWHIVPLTSDTYRLSPWNSPSSALTVLGSGYNKNGVPITGIWTFAGTSNQIWKITSDDGQQFRISPLCSPDLALGVEGGLPKDNNRIEVYRYFNPSAQNWWIVSASRS